MRAGVSALLIRLPSEPSLSVCPIHHAPLSLGETPSLPYGECALAPMFLLHDATRLDKVPSSEWSHDLSYSNQNLCCSWDLGAGPEDSVPGLLPSTEERQLQGC